MKKLIVLAVITMALFFAVCSRAEEVHDVSNLIEFQNALSTALSNGDDDTINVAAGIYTVTSNLTYYPSNAENFSLSIIGDGIGSTILDGGDNLKILHLDTRALTSDSNAHIIIKGITFQNGSCQGTGGGAMTIATNDADVTVIGSQFSSNTCFLDAGGIFVRADANGNINLINNIFNGNSARTGGGALLWVSADSIDGTTGTINLTNNTFHANSADIGGGVTLTPNNVEDACNIYNNIIWNNTAAIGADLYVYNASGSSVNVFNNDFSDVIISDIGNLSQGNNINEAPLLSAAFHLLADSSAIDTGDNSAPLLPSNDYEGDPRIINGIVDMGADEDVCYAYDFECDDDVDILDIMIVASRWNTYLGDPSYDAQYDFDNDEDIDIADVMKIATQWGWTQIQEGCLDEDGDGYGNPASPLCEHPEFDCDDTDPNIYGEVCELVKKFAPVLWFAEDYIYHCLPMSAEEYFQKMLYPVTDNEANTITWKSPYDWNATEFADGYPDCDPENDIVVVKGRDFRMCGMCSNDITELKDGKIPTYYRVFRDDGFHQNRLRIAYYWFYGFQTPCNLSQLLSDGSHHGDWETIMVTTTPDQSAIDAVTYWFHGNFYTRRAGNFLTYGGEERPVVYVGKIGHGSYHSDDHSGIFGGTGWECCEYADWRNPVIPDTEWSNTNDYLVNMDGNLETWMAAERAAAAEKGLYSYLAKYYVVQGGPVAKGSDEKGPGDRWVWGPNRIIYDTWSQGNESTWTVEGPMSAYGYQKDWRIHSCLGKGCGVNWSLRCPYSAYLDQGWPFQQQDDGGLHPAIVYEASNFQGKKMILTGQDRIPNLSVYNLANQISSVSVADGYILNLYRHVDYQDQAWQYVGENANIGYFNDYANSLKVIEGNIEESACIYEAANYSSGEKCYYDVIEDGFLGPINEKVSSVRVYAGYKVTLYKDIYFGGETCELTTDTANITVGCDNSWNDVASSLKIEKFN